jgi:hypothetical protein
MVGHKIVGHDFHRELPSKAEPILNPAKPVWLSLFHESAAKAKKFIVYSEPSRGVLAIKFIADGRKTELWTHRTALDE